MEFKIAVEELQSIVTRLSYIVRMNDTGTPGMILIDVNENGEVVFKATDGSMHLVVSAANCEVVSPGKSLFYLREIRGYVMKFVPLIDNYGTKDFHFMINFPEGLLKTKTEFPSNRPAYRKLKFLAFDPSVFPIIKPFDEAQLIVNSSVLRTGIERVLHCINPTDVRRPLTGVNMTIMDDKVVFVGTNGIKLSEFTVEINADISNKSYILRYNFASALKSVLDNDAQVFMKFDAGNVYAKSNHIYLAGNLIVSEAYPDYKVMFNLNQSFEIPRLDFADSVKTVMDVLDPEDNHRLNINITDKRMSLRNDKTESIQDFEENFGFGLDIDVNGLFLESILRDFRDDQIVVNFQVGNPYIVFQSPHNTSQVSLISLLKRR